VLQIQFPYSYLQEKKYICHVIFTEFLGVIYSLEFLPELKDKVIISLEGKEVAFPEILFSTPLEGWLKKRSFPKEPLRQRQLDDLPFFDKFLHNQVPVIYGSDKIENYNSDTDSSFFDIDIFGSIFFTITRYEEIDHSGLDEFGRYYYSQSIASKENFLHRAIVNEYLDILWALLSDKFSLNTKKKRTYKVILSHDVDVPITLNTGLKSVIRKSIGDVVSRKSLRLLLKRIISILLYPAFGFRFDPNNNFDFIMDCSEKAGIQSHFYFIVVDGKGGIDGKYDIQSPFFKKLLKKIHYRGHIIGIHPSFYTYKNYNQTAVEFNNLKELCKSEGIVQDEWGGRQHYLRWVNPETWRIWNEMGADYSSTISYEHALGFRCGTCYPYSVFDLLESKHLKLVEKPMVIMDVSVFLQKKGLDAIEEMISFSRICKAFDGEFNILFHNNYVISPNEKNMYANFIKSII
jgi:hypothetical protein